MIFAIFFATALLKAALRALRGTWLVTKHLAWSTHCLKAVGFFELL